MSFRQRYNQALSFLSSKGLITDFRDYSYKLREKKRTNGYECNHCGKIIKKTGGSANESGMIDFHYVGFPEREKTSVYYCHECAVDIAKEILDEVL